jgi:hypothetical protein
LKKCRTIPTNIADDAELRPSVAEAREFTRRIVARARQSLEAHGQAGVLVPASRALRVQVRPHLNRMRRLMRRAADVYRDHQEMSDEGLWQSDR